MPTGVFDAAVRRHGEVPCTAPDFGYSDRHVESPPSALAALTTKSNADIIKRRPSIPARRFVGLKPLILSFVKFINSLNRAMPGGAPKFLLKDAEISEDSIVLAAVKDDGRDKGTRSRNRVYD